MIKENFTTQLKISKIILLIRYIIINFRFILIKIIQIISKEFKLNVSKIIIILFFFIRGIKNNRRKTIGRIDR